MEIISIKNKVKYVVVPLQILSVSGAVLFLFAEKIGVVDHSFLYQKIQANIIST